jgi:hypothetical protein
LELAARLDALERLGAPNAEGVEGDSARDRGGSVSHRPLFVNVLAEMQNNLAEGVR